MLGCLFRVIIMVIIRVRFRIRVTITITIMVTTKGPRYWYRGNRRYQPMVRSVPRWHCL